MGREARPEIALLLVKQEPFFMQGRECLGFCGWHRDTVCLDQVGV